MATSGESEELTAFVLTTDSDSSFTFSTVLTTVNVADFEKESAIRTAIEEAMPLDLYDRFDPQSGGPFAAELVQEFDAETYPSWLAQLPETVQTHFITRWMGVLLDSTDLLGSSSTVVKAMVLTKGTDGVTTTAAGTATFAVSQSWHYMSVLGEHVPAAVLLLSDSYAAFATAVYEQFTSGTAPPWFGAMPTDVQSFVVLDYLPNNLDEPMTLDILALASPAARPTATAEPTTASSPTLSTPSATSDKSGLDDSPSPRINVAVMTGIIVAVISLVLILSFAIWFLQRRKARRARSSINTLPPLDPERALRRWSDTTFNTALHPQNQSMDSPQTAELHFPGSISHPLRRALSESHLENVSSVGTKETNPKSAASHEDRVELEAVKSPLVRC